MKTQNIEFKKKYTKNRIEVPFNLYYTYIYL